MAKETKRKSPRTPEEMAAIGSKGGLKTKKRRGKAWFKKLAAAKWKKYKTLSPEDQKQFAGGRKPKT